MKKILAFFTVMTSLSFAMEPKAMDRDYNNTPPPATGTSLRTGEESRPIVPPLPLSGIMRDPDRAHEHSSSSHSHRAPNRVEGLEPLVSPFSSRTAHETEGDRGLTSPWSMGPERSPTAGFTPPYTPPGRRLSNSFELSPTSMASSSSLCRYSPQSLSASILAREDSRLGSKQDMAARLQRIESAYEEKINTLQIQLREKEETTCTLRLQLERERRALEEERQALRDERQGGQSREEVIYTLRRQLEEEGETVRALQHQLAEERQAFENEREENRRRLAGMREQVWAEEMADARLSAEISQRRAALISHRSFDSLKQSTRDSIIEYILAREERIFRVKNHEIKAKDQEIQDLSNRLELSRRRVAKLITRERAVEEREALVAGRESVIQESNALVAERTWERDILIAQRDGVEERARRAEDRVVVLEREAERVNAQPAPEQQGREAVECMEREQRERRESLRRELIVELGEPILNERLQFKRTLAYLLDNRGAISQYSVFQNAALAYQERSDIIAQLEGLLNETSPDLSAAWRQDLNQEGIMSRMEIGEIFDTNAVPNQWPQHIQRIIIGLRRSSTEITSKAKKLLEKTRRAIRETGLSPADLDKQASQIQVSELKSILEDDLENINLSIRERARGETLENRLRQLFGCKQRKPAIPKLAQWQKDLDTYGPEDTVSSLKENVKALDELKTRWEEWEKRLNTYKRTQEGLWLPVKSGMILQDLNWDSVDIQAVKAARNWQELLQAYKTKLRDL